MKGLSNRISWVGTIALTVGAFGAAMPTMTLAAPPPPQGLPTHYEPNEQSLSRHRAPEWFRDAKLGIFIHWGIYSVPGYAPREAKEYDEELTEEDAILNPYAEWYYNTSRIEGSPSWRFHRNAYGADFNYYTFAKTFNAATKDWNPETWADLFKNLGARYVVLTTKHHDGFTLWPSKFPNPHLDPALSHSDRDLVGDLTQAVRARGMKMGLYYSGIFDWSFTAGPIKDLPGLAAASAQGPEYIRYADAQWSELIDRYKPDILWNDIGYSPKGDLLKIIADYYNRVPLGLANDRWAPFKIADFRTSEYTKLAEISVIPWEHTRGIGKSFGLNRMEGAEESINPDALVDDFADIVSKNGNLLLDIGPEPDGTLPKIQLERLTQFAGWLHQNGEAIFATRPWVRATGKTADGIEVRFTTKPKTLYAILLSRPAGRSVTLLDVPASIRTATWLGTSAKLQVSHRGNDAVIAVPANLPGDYAWALRLQ